MNIGNYEIQVPFVTSSANSMKELKEIAKPFRGSLATDLGSGNGKVIVQLGKLGLQVKGYEINDSLVHLSKKLLEREKLQSSVSVLHQSFWEADLSRYNFIYVYGMSTIMSRLELKLQNEVLPNTCIVSNIFSFPHWKTKHLLKNLRVYLKK